MFASNIRRSPVKGVADARFHLGNFFICELLKLGLALKHQNHKFRVFRQSLEIHQVLRRFENL